jgi:hypothetical protein
MPAHVKPIMTIACQGHLFWNPTETQILPRIMIKTYGIIAGKRISGSRTPRLRLVARAETQSLNGPAVARPIKAPTSMAKFVKPVSVSWFFFFFSNFVMRVPVTYQCFDCSNCRAVQQMLEFG